MIEALLPLLICGLVLITLGGGLLRAVEAVTGRLRASSRKPVRKSLIAFGWLLAILGIIPTIALLFVLGIDAWHAPYSEMRWLTVLCLTVPFLVLAFGGILLILVVGELADPSASRPVRFREQLAFLGWLLVLSSGVSLLSLLVRGIVIVVAGYLPVLLSVETIAAVVCYVALAVMMLTGGIGLIRLRRPAAFRSATSGSAYADKRLDALMVIGWFLCCLGIVLSTTILAIPILIAAAVIASRRRAAQQDSLLWFLTVAAHKQLPLAPSAAAFSEQCRGLYRRRILAIAELMNSGASLPEALGMVPGVLPPNVELSVRIGWESGGLAVALRDAAASRAQGQPVWGAWSVKVLYLLALLISIQAITGFLLYYILPKFKVIFDGFETRLPRATALLIQGSSWFIEYFYLIELPFLVLLVYLPLAFWGWVNWRPRFVDKLLLRLDTARILRALAMTLAVGQPLTTGIRTLARSYPRRWIRERLERVHESVSDGADWCESLRLAGLLPPTDAAVLASAQRVGNLVWALRELADGGERRLAYRLQVLAQVLFPVLVVALGSVVFFIMLGFFTPLVKLISEVS